MNLVKKSIFNQMENKIWRVGSQSLANKANRRPHTFIPRCSIASRSLHKSFAAASLGRDMHRARAEKQWQMKRKGSSHFHSKQKL
jgi:hypothetical protein